MTILSGFLYIKHGRVGTRSEGPDYYLQMADGEVFLQYEERMLWDPDYHLEYFGRRMVEIEGELLEAQKVQVREIKEICETTIPQIYAE